MHMLSNETESSDRGHEQHKVVELVVISTSGLTSMVLLIAYSVSRVSALLYFGPRFHKKAAEIR